MWKIFGNETYFSATSFFQHLFVSEFFYFWDNEKYFLLFLDLEKTLAKNRLLDFVCIELSTKSFRVFISKKTRKKLLSSKIQKFVIRVLVLLICEWFHFEKSQEKSELLFLFCQQIKFLCCHKYCHQKSVKNI